MAEPRREERAFVDSHGIRIFYDVHSPAATPRAVIQLLHGVGEHAGRYARTIADLVAAGYVVYADDHRGHGRTGMAQHHGDRTKLGRLGPGGVRAARDACARLTGLIRADHPDLPLVLLGHSWGSLLAQMLLDGHPDAYDAVVLTGTALRWPGAMNAGDLNAPWKAADAMGTEWLSSDLSVGRAFLDDPLTTTATVRTLFGLVDGARLFGLPARNLTPDVPVLIMVGRDDTLGGPRSAHRLAEAYRRRSGLSDVTTLVYPGVRHEIFNDVTRADVIADLLAWLDRRLPVRD
ncbi:alpha/beta hydrolase [Microbacterium dextranolyticum]|uniref:Lysophospholipase n=1 Tax=Microbacterium dextranolyticum TaxID=36806 RepID=A0A9W6HLV5_9MICO|nr:alpha/beta hydrolase [Microbacterium dextranolyticum]MBM7464154.1 alpha-beta hydrolase superfamily lysophospholipase [Microbacterium dextranolyticum]GLJ95149.1 putative lysophospholipase [Microbacterium dextranolyticum]